MGRVPVRMSPCRGSLKASAAISSSGSASRPYTRHGCRSGRPLNPCAKARNPTGIAARGRYCRLSQKILARSPGDATSKMKPSVQNASPAATMANAATPGRARRRQQYAATAAEMAVERAYERRRRAVEGCIVRRAQVGACKLRRSPRQHNSFGALTSGGRRGRAAPLGAICRIDGRVLNPETEWGLTRSQRSHRSFLVPFPPLSRREARSVR
jgi:hypothetical protein